jgi:hypothetical protein
MQHGRLIYSDSTANMTQYGNGEMTLEEVFLEITTNRGTQEPAQ